MIELIIVIVVWIYLLVQTVNAIMFYNDDYRKKHKNKIDELPNICVLVAARNEEKNIENCIKSLLKLNYPADKLNILIGNDNSEDNTENILIKYCNNFNHLNYINITERVGKAKAKANVLAQLIQKTNEEYIFITDADIVVEPNWINDLLPFLLLEKFDIVSGTTVVKGNTFFQQMQGMEWLLANTQIIGFDRLGIKTTAVGNNMAISRNAYIKTGGYENMEYSVTEDFQLYKYVLKNGGKTLNTLRKESLNTSTAPDNIITYFHQRKRWMKGAEGLPFLFKLILALYALFFPLILILVYINWFLGVIVWVAKFAIQFFVFITASKRLKQPIKIYNLLLYEVYTNLNTLAMIVFYLIPIKMIWKNRTD